MSEPQDDVQALKRRIAELETETAHLISAMKDMWLAMRRAQQKDGGDENA